MKVDGAFYFQILLSCYRSKEKDVRFLTSDICLKGAQSMLLPLWIVNSREAHILPESPLLGPHEILFSG